MSRIRVRIGQLILQHLEISTADGARMSRMVEAQLEKLLQAGATPSARNASVTRATAALPAGKQATETASAIARGIHQEILKKH